MHYKIRRGVDKNFIITIHNKLKPGVFEVISEHLPKINWRNKKAFIIIESGQNPVMDDRVEQLFLERLDQGYLSACHVINPGTINKRLNGYGSPEEFMSKLEKTPICDSLIFILGNNESQVQCLTRFLSEITNPINLEVDLDAILANIEFYKSMTRPTNKVMAMVKANAYGHGLVEVAHHLKHSVDYFGVAYVNEGISLRRENIETPVMVMNPSEHEFDLCLKYNLEPEIYSLSSLNVLNNLLEERKTEVGIHIEIDTGMNRLGFEEDEIDALIRALKKTEYIRVRGIFSHMACAEDPEEDDFNREQHRSFMSIASKIETALGISSIRHLRNSAGTLRYTDFPTDMIRLGIGIYGIDTNHLYQDQLRNTCILKTEISQIRKVEKGETIGYNRTFTAKKNMTVATTAIGYADGFKRIFSNGIGEVIIKGVKVPVVGRVNMDMTMVDVTDLDVNIGEEVIILNRELHPSALAKKAGTIPYEVFTSIGARVVRTYTFRK
ncbi:MAG: alanine racemase [Cytophagales bacterium]|nr:alanine racemase [Cytophagales bacterium]